MYIYCAHNDDIGQVLNNALIHNRRTQKENFEEDNVVTSFSDIEIIIIQLIVEENPISQIAEKMFVSVNTIKTHKKRICIKLKIDNQIQLAKNG